MKKFAAALLAALTALSGTAFARSVVLERGTEVQIRVVDRIKSNKVKKGQVLMILEAMKMENEIMCPRDGKVLSVAVTKGSAVESGALLCTIQ